MLCIAYEYYNTYTIYFQHGEVAITKLISEFNLFVCYKEIVSLAK